MASISSPPFQPPYTDPTSRNSQFRNPKKFLNFTSRHSPPLLKPSDHHHHQTFPSSSSSSSRVSDSTPLCRCSNQNRESEPPPSDSSLHNVVKNAIKKLEDYLNSFFSGSPTKNVSPSVVDVVEGGSEWDWERWKKHFDDVDQQEKIVSVLKAQLGDAIRKEDYEDAARLKVAIAAAATNDTVGLVITQLNRALEEERYQDATFIRDYASAGLVGWWAGISEDSDDPYGRIIRINAEHGRYVARSYSPRRLNLERYYVLLLLAFLKAVIARHLATAAPGVPLFEIFLTTSGKSEYKKQAVYLKRLGGNSGDLLTKAFKSSNSSTVLNPLSGSIEAKNDLPTMSSKDILDTEDKDDDSDATEGLDGFQSALQDIIPGVKVMVLKVTAPENVDRDLISDVIEQIMEDEEDEDEDEDEEKDVEIESSDKDDESRTENHEEDDNEIDGGLGINNNSEEGQSEMAVKVVIGGRVQKLPSNVSPKALLRVPAILEQKGRLSFSFSIKNDDRALKETAIKGHTPPDKNAKFRGQRNINSVMSELAKSITNRKRIPMKVLKDVEELINFTLSQAKNRQLLSGTTTFNRIEIPASSDLLSGLYVGVHGLYTSEVIHLKRKFGQWQEDGLTQKPPNLEFYEYVEALKLTGDPQVPAGQVAFRAKVGKQYQLPHKGIIPEEFGVVARYKGQGRLAEPGFQNPRWVDGELVILDGKYIKGGPVVGFVYWAPDYHFLVFFNRLRLQE
ncbi:hypothetical protein GIB67_019548 [Kingdonia uniflora]|uniref:Protein EXECUTER 1, chloroplastic n=1 Tax=Kingdonia uniflora TaxID=39325 RepID=A0A7J7N0Z8_9MAGN|nr:hypothetical protein GIB67_019548 [Kingdonia uniflora]